MKLLQAWPNSTRDTENKQAVRRVRNKAAQRSRKMMDLRWPTFDHRHRSAYTAEGNFGCTWRCLHRRLFYACGRRERRSKHDLRAEQISFLYRMSQQRENFISWLSLAVAAVVAVNLCRCCRTYGRGCCSRRSNFCSLSPFLRFPCCSCRRGRYSTSYTSGLAFKTK